MITGIRPFLPPAVALAAALSAPPASAGLLDSNCHSLGLLGGYRQHDLGDRMFQISVLGNGFAGQDFLKTCTIERAQTIASERGFSRFAIIKFKGTATYRRGTDNYLNGSVKTVIKLLAPGETAEPLKDGEVIYFNVASMQPEAAPEVQAAAPPRGGLSRVGESRATPSRSAEPVDVLGLVSDPEHYD